MKHGLMRFAFLAALSITGPATAADLGAIIESCDGCHGTDGVSQWDDIPTIAGIDAFVHSDALWVYQEQGRRCATAAFRQGDMSRPATDMCAVAAELSDDQIEEIADHYAALPFVPAAQDFDATLAAQGKGIHDDQCKRCHSEGGSNPEDEASILAGQWMGYLEATFAEYAAGDREQPEKMKEKLDLLGPADVTALIHYYASQQ